MNKNKETFIFAINIKWIKIQNEISFDILLYASQLNSANAPRKAMLNLTWTSNSTGDR